MSGLGFVFRLITPSLSNFLLSIASLNAPFLLASPFFYCLQVPMPEIMQFVVSSWEDMAAQTADEDPALADKPLPKELVPVPRLIPTADTITWPVEAQEYVDDQVRT